MILFEEVPPGKCSHGQPWDFDRGVGRECRECEVAEKGGSVSVARDDLKTPELKNGVLHVYPGEPWPPARQQIGIPARRRPEALVLADAFRPVFQPLPSLESVLVPKTLPGLRAGLTALKGQTVAMVEELLRRAEHAEAEAASWKEIAQESNRQFKDWLDADEEEDGDALDRDLARLRVELYDRLTARIIEALDAEGLLANRGGGAADIVRQEIERWTDTEGESAA